MQRHLNPNKIWSSKSAVKHRKRVKFKSQSNFFSKFSLPSFPKPFSIYSLSNIFNSKQQSVSSRPIIRKHAGTEFKIFKPTPKDIVKENIKNSLHFCNHQGLKSLITFCIPITYFQECVNSDFKAQNI